VMDGEIIEHLPPNPLHAALAGIVAALLKGVFEARGYCVREEKPIRLKEYFDPQPDVAVVRGRPRDYLERFPAPQEVALLVEIAESSLAYDRGRKRSAYAAAGIAEYWILDLEQAQVEGYREPSGGEYLSHRIYKLEESVSPLAAPDAFLQVAALLGRE